MGMFDTVAFTCPKCDEVIEEQSKAGECVLARYSSNEVPNDIALSIEGETVWCGNCSIPYQIIILPEKGTRRLGLVRT